MTSPRFLYTQARLQARNAERLSRAAWDRLAGSHGVERFLEAASVTPLARFVHSVTHDTDAGKVEQLLLTAYAAHTDEVADWVPPDWSNAVRFVRWLPLLERLESGAAGADWIAASPVPAGPGASREWFRQFRGLCPRPGELDPLSTVVRDHLKEMRDTSVEQNGWTLRAKLSITLERLLRRRPATPVAVFAHLGLTLLELERLRAELLLRTSIAPAWRQVAWA
ncbi:MAG: hypothetical protein IPI67_39765 [Myxococcales bacterium]|nr:hypothetical protein [Myxococcales bacterium]